MTDDGDCVAWKRQTAVQHCDEGSTPRPTVIFEAPRGEDGLEIQRKLPGVINAQGGLKSVNFAFDMFQISGRLLSLNLRLRE